VGRPLGRARAAARQLDDLRGDARAAAALFYQHDGDLAFVSRNRTVLSSRFRFVIGDGPLVEALLDKTLFSELAASLSLPVPCSFVLRPTGRERCADLPFDYPLILKPLTRIDSMWLPLAVGEGDPARLQARPRGAVAVARSTGYVFLAQELIPGGEERIESYHAYVDERGDVAGEFTGRKIRTFPSEYGQTTALTITDEATCTSSAVTAWPRSGCTVSRSSTSSATRRASCSCSR